MAKRRNAKSSFNGWAFLAFIIVIGLIVEYFIPILILIGLAGGGYLLYKKNKAGQELQLTTQIDDLKTLIASTDRKIKRLETYEKKGDETGYLRLAEDIESNLTTIEGQTERLKSEIEPAVAKRIFEKIDNVREEMATTMTKMGDVTQKAIHTDLPEEVRQIIRNIRVDHQTITEKIEQSESGNKEELMAVHHMQMERFEDILEGYQKMLAEPKNYYHAEERIAAAVDAMKQFDLDLDETLKQLNEADMRDFEISLRIIKHKTKDDGGDDDE
ncbi:hypothetical protein [Streptococcus himalayensis]|uniref:Membrane protein n=1 Tax=Streptococcus himalayensis TaxID=1888195 RepID=A0A917EEP9_9STRE|nr:hypothetical protein [Streptococcus himalayensis]GGE29886.1 membrane protein [Streptococcus himalayensis]